MVEVKPKSAKAPVISVPTAKDEQVRLGKVGVVAIVGLAIGIAWPKILGLHLVSALPTDAAVSATAASAAAAITAPAPVSASPPGLVTTTTVSHDEPPPTVRPPKVTLAQVVSCRSKDGEREAHCDTPAIDSVIQTPLQSLVACDAAENARGMLSIGFDLDFETQKLDHLTVGRSTTLAANVAKQLLHCGEKELARVALDGVEHKKSSYRIFYKVEFGGDSSTPNAPAESGTPEGQPSNEVVSASGRVTVTWDAALVRAKPKDGEVLARVLGGTRLTVTGRQGEWYHVKYDSKGSEGWVYKAAIGL